MNYNLLNIKNILLFFVVVIALIVLCSIILFINKHSQLQNQFAYFKFEQSVTALAQQLDKEIELGKQNVYRLKKYVSILDSKSENMNDKIAFLQNLMADNLQFEKNHYSHYIAIEPYHAQRLFNHRGKLLLVYKNIALHNTKKYNNPQYMLQKSFNEPSYANNPRNAWYYMSKYHFKTKGKAPVDMQITPIYFDQDYTNNVPVFSISQGFKLMQTFTGVVGISILADPFFEEVENQKLGETGGMLLVDSKKGLLLSKIGKIGSRQLSFINATERQYFYLKQPFWKKVLNQNISYIEVKNGNGNLYSLSSKKLGTLPWTLVSYQQTSELKQGNFYGIFIISGTIIFISLMIMVGVFFKTLILPISNLLNTIQGLSQSPSKVLVSRKSVTEIRLLAKVFRQLASDILKTSSESYEYLMHLEASRLIQAKQKEQIKRYHSQLVKNRRKMQNAHEKIQKARLQIQKARVEIQKYKLEAKRAKVQSDTANQVKSHFLANMSHDLRTPMNAIIGYTEMLQEDAKEQKQEDFLPDLQKIHGASYHLLDLINNLLDLSKMESSKMDLYIDTFDIAPMIQDVASTIAPLLEKQSNILKVNCDSALGTMSTDLTKLRRNLFTLLSNATKFSKQSTISITVTRESVNLMDWILFRITDQGIGMTKEQIQKLFQAFIPADTTHTHLYSSSGLGLAITKQFCQIMGGDIVVESELGQGCTFIMRLPVHTNLPEN